VRPFIEQCLKLGAGCQGLRLHPVGPVGNFVNVTSKDDPAATAADRAPRLELLYR